MRSPTRDEAECFRSHSRLTLVFEAKGANYGAGLATLFGPGVIKAPPDDTARSHEMEKGTQV
jgi:hypothetical protein